MSRNVFPSAFASPSASRSKTRQAAAARRRRRLLMEHLEDRRLLAFDFGDAPESYGTLLAANGARHEVSAALYFGFAFDTEDDGQPSADALGDDNNGVPDDEDGLQVLTPLVIGGQVDIAIRVGGIVPGCYANAWIDWNGNGSFGDEGEHLAVDEILAPNPPEIPWYPVSFDIPPEVQPTAGTYVRIRVSTLPGIDPDTQAVNYSYDGAAPNGEVEDYKVAILAPPIITSNGGGATAAISFLEGTTTAVTRVTAKDADGPGLTYSLSGGVDQGKFTLDATTGILRFLTPPDFEAPTDSDGNNSYVVQVRAFDGTLEDLQTITVTVTDEPPVVTSPATIQWWSDPQLQNREGYTGALGPHYWTKDESDQFLFVTSHSGVATGSAHLYRIADLIAAHADNVPTPVASVATSTELGVSFLRGGAVSDDLGRALSGTALTTTPVFASLPTDGTPWTTANVAKIRNDKNIDHDSMAFSHDSTLMFSNSYSAPRNIVHTWNVGDLTHDGVGLTQAATFASTNTTRIRSLSSYYIGGQDLVYYGDGGAGLKVMVYDPAANTETVLLEGLTDGTQINYVKVSGLGTSQMYLHVGSEKDDPVTGSPTIAVYELAADGKSVESTTPVARFAGAALMTDILGATHTYSRAFEVTNDGQFGLFGTHAAANVYTVSADVPVPRTTLEEVAITFDADGTDVDVPGQTVTYALPAGAPEGAAIDSGSGVFTWTPTEAQGPGDYTFRVQAIDGAATSDRWITLRVTEVNDEPVGIDSTVTALEDTPYAFAPADFGFSDPNDLPANSLGRVQITTLPALGSLKLGTTAVAPGQFVTLAEIPNLNYTTGTENASGSPYTTFTFQVEDNGGTDNGGVDLDATPNLMTINVTAVNDAPFVFVYTDPENPNLWDCWEDHEGTLPAGALQVFDVDAGDGILQTTMTVVNGTVTLGSTAGLTFSTGDGTDDALMVFTSTLAAMNAAAVNSHFYPTLNFVGTATITVTVNDQGNTPAPAKEGTGVVTIPVLSVNDPPEGADKTVTIDEDTIYTFAAADFGFTDPNDSPANALNRVKIATLPALGSLKLSGAAVAAGDFITLANIPNLTFTPAAEANGIPYTNFTFQVEDDGGTERGGVNLDPTPNMMLIHVTPVNDAPVIFIYPDPAAWETWEDSVGTLPAGALSFTDVDAGDGIIRTSITVVNGTVSVNPAALGQLTFITGDGTDDTEMVFTSTLAALNAAVVESQFKPPLNFVGTATIAITVDDQGNTPAPAKTASGTVTIPVTPVNDPPQGADKTVATPQNTAYTFAAADFGFTDPDDSPANAFNRVKITTLPAAGTLQLSGTPVAEGDFVAAAEIPNLKFEPAAGAMGNPYAAFTFQVEDDGGTTHGGVPLDQSPNTITINVLPTVTLAVSRATIGEDAGVAVFTASLSAVSAEPVTVDIGFTGTAVSPDDYTRSGVQIVIPAGAWAGSVAVTAVPDANAEGDETVIADITGVAGALEAATQQQTTTILDGHPPLITVPEPFDWWIDPRLQSRQSYPAPTGVGPHYWTKDESEQVLFVTSNSDGVAATASLFSIPALVTAHADDVVTPLASAAAADLGATVSHLRGGAVSDDLGRVLSGTSVPPGNPVLASLPTDGTPWTAASVAKISNDLNVKHDGMSFSHDSTLLFSNNYNPSADRERVYTWHVGDLTHDGVGLTVAQFLDSAHTTRIRSLSSYYIGGHDLVYYGDGALGAKVMVYDPATNTETVLLDGLTDGTQVNNVKISGIGTGQMYLYVGSEQDVPVTGSPTIAVYLLAADGRSVESTTPVARFAGAALMTDILGTAHTYSRAFEVTNDGQFGFFGTHATAHVYTVSADVPAGTTLEEVPITFDAEATDADVPAQTLTFSLAGAPPDAAIAPDTGVFTWTPTEAQGPGDYTFQVLVSDGVFSDAAWITLRVTEVNDEPVGIDSTVTALEDTAYAFAPADFGFSDPNDLPANALDRVQITTLPALGSLKLGTTAVAPGQFVTLAEIPNLNYTTGTENASGSPYTTFTFQVEDNGGTDNGGVNLDATPNLMTINVTAVNDAPFVFVYTDPENPNLWDCWEDGQGTLPAGALQVFDVDAGDGILQTTMTVVNGTVTLGSTAGLTFSTGDGTDDALMVFTSTLAAMNNAAVNSHFYPADNFVGTATITITVNDQGNTPAPAKEGTGVVTIPVLSVNDPPEGADKTVTIDEDTIYTFAAADFGFTDPIDSPANALSRVKIATLPALGSLKLSGAAVAAGDFITLANIPNLTFTPAAEANGIPYTNFTFQVEDDGGTERGGVNLDPTENQMLIHVTAVNDAPTIFIWPVLEDWETWEDSEGTLPAGALQFSDVDAGDGVVQTSITVVNGTVSVNPTALPLLTFITGGGTKDTEMVFTSTLAALQAAVIDSHFYPTLNFVGTATIAITVNDQGNTPAPAQETKGTVTIPATSVNDPPEGADKTVATPQNTAYTFAAADFGFTDPDDSPANAFNRVKIATLPAAGTLKVSGTPVAAGDFVTLPNIPNLTFEPATGGSGSPYAAFTFQVEDDGGTTHGGVNLDPTANTMTINVVPATLIVSQFTPTVSGFVAQFSRAFQLPGLNLYDGASGALGPADVLLTDGTGKTVAGSMVVAGDARSFEFVKTGGVLAADTYAVTIKSSATAFRDTDGGLLDGDGNGVTGDDYTKSFTVAASSDVVVSVPDLARGAGQPVDIPNGTPGLPIRVDNAAGVTALAVDLAYDSTLLNITAAALGAAVPGDWTVTLDTASTPGVAKVTAQGTTALAGTNVDVVRLTAAVPAAALYGAVQALHLNNVALNGGALAAAGDVAVHKAAYLGDADSSSLHSSADAFQVQQVALGSATGFPAHAWTDPRIVADCDRSGALSAADAFLVVQEGLGQSEPFIPNNPKIAVTHAGAGVDPQFQIATDLVARQGGTVTVPVNLSIDPAATAVGALDFELSFDPARLSIELPGGVAAGADTAGWAVSATLLAPGRLRVAMVSVSGRPLAVGLRQIARLQFRVEPTDHRSPITDYRSPITAILDGSETHPTALDIEPVDPRAGGYAWTAADGSVLIQPAVRTAVAAAREQVWRKLDAKADLLDGVLDGLLHDLASAWR